MAETTGNISLGDRWPARRDEYLRKYGVCEVCRSCNPFYIILAHHLTYDRAGGDELDSDLITLCKADHDALHADYNRALHEHYDSSWVPRPVWEQHLRSFSLEWIVRAHHRFMD